MRSVAPALMPIFRSSHQAELLTLLLLHPDRDYSVTELAREPAELRRADAAWGEFWAATQPSS